MEMNKNIEVYSDENYISFLRQNSEIKNLLTTINNKYNVGLTHMEKRYNAADKPVCSLGFQPHVQNSWDVFIEGKNDLDLKFWNSINFNVNTRPTRDVIKNHRNFHTLGKGFKMEVNTFLTRFTVVGSDQK